MWSGDWTVRPGQLCLNYQPHWAWCFVDMGKSENKKINVWIKTIWENNNSRWNSTFQNWFKESRVTNTYTYQYWEKALSYYFSIRIQLCFYMYFEKIFFGFNHEISHHILAPFLSEAVEASQCHFFGNWLMKHKCPKLLKPQGTIIW